MTEGVSKMLYDHVMHTQSDEEIKINVGEKSIQEVLDQLVSYSEI